MSRQFVVLFAACLLIATPLKALAAGFEHVSSLAYKGFLISAKAQLLDTGEVLGAIAPQRQLSPASVSKLYVAAAALDQWGPQHRFSTRLVTMGHIDAQGVLHGDLVFVGGGDPALVSEDLWRLIQRLRLHGVTHIDGRLVVSQWRYGPVKCITTDRCESRTRSDNAYSALLSSAGVNYASWCLKVLPGARAGAEAMIRSCGTVTPSMRVDNRVTTTTGGGATTLSAERVTDAQGDTMIVRGQIALGTYPRGMYVASSEPARQTAQTLLAMIEDAGISVAGGATTSETRPPSGARQLAAVDGKPLQELLLRMLNYSNNFMADVLALDLVETPRATLLQAGAELERFARGLPGHGPLTLLSGSGLTPENRTSAQGVNALLEAMYHRSALFPTFVAGMQVPVNGPMTFIQRGSELFQSHVMLKTGTLNEPVSVRALGGYFRTESGRWGSFSVLVNGTGSTPYLSWFEVLPLVAEDLTAMIATH